MRYLCSLLLPLLFATNLVAQPISEADSTAASAVCKEIIAAQIDGNPELMRAKIAEVKGMPHTPGQAAALVDWLGTAAFMSGDSDSAMYFYQLSIAMDSALNNERGVAYTKANMANVYMARGELELALKCLLELLSEKATENDLTHRAGLLGDIALLYDYQGNFPLAREYAQRSLDLFVELDDQNGQLRLRNQLATISYFEGDLETAVTLWENALSLIEGVAATSSVASIYSNLSKARQLLGNLDGALQAAQKAFELDQALGYVTAIGQSHERMAGLLAAMGRPAEAKTHGYESLRIAQKAGQIPDTEKAAQTLVAIESALGNYKKALEMQQLATQMRDSLKNEENTHQLAELEASFKYEQQALQDSIEAAEREKLTQAQLAAEQAESEQKSQQLWFLGVLLLLAGAGVVFVLNRNRAAQRQNRIIAEQKEEVETINEQLDARNSEKEVLLKEIHHRVKNNLQIISSLLELQSRGIDDESALSAVADGQSRVKSMALIHQKLYQTDDIATVDFGSYASDLCAQLAALYPDMNETQLNIEGNGIELDIDTAIPLGLILNELVTNAFKYGIKGQSAGSLKVELRAEGKGSYLLTVADNGPGLPEDFNFDKTRSLGLRLVRRLSKQLYGKATYQNNEGAIFAVTFKDTEARKEVA